MERELRRLSVYFKDDRPNFVLRINVQSSTTRLYIWTWSRRRTHFSIHQGLNQTLKSSSSRIKLKNKNPLKLKWFGNSLHHYSAHRVWLLFFHFVAISFRFCDRSNFLLFAIFTIHHLFCIYECVWGWKWKLCVYMGWELRKWKIKKRKGHFESGSRILRIARNVNLRRCGAFILKGLER